MRSGKGKQKRKNGAKVCDFASELCKGFFFSSAQNVESHVVRLSFRLWDFFLLFLFLKEMGGAL